MKAKDMFKELGYELNIDDEIEKQYYKEDIGYVYGNDFEDTSLVSLISFYIRDKTYYCQRAFEPMDVDLDTNNAIQKQIEELGWDD